MSDEVKAVIAVLAVLAGAVAAFVLVWAVTA